MPTTAPPDDAIVRLCGVHKSFGRLKVLRGVDLAFGRGRCTVVMGPSGCGKSVMLKHVNGLIRPDSGEVWFEQTRVDQLSEVKLGPVRRQIGFLFQQSALFDSMSVLDNVAFPLVEHEKLDAEERQRRVLEVLRMVGVADMASAMPADLSGGQRKRVALARAIVLRPALMIYDEPTTGLDPIRADVINELIIRLQRRLRMTSIVVTHDLASAFKVADRMVMLYDGQVVLEASPEDFRRSDNPIVQGFLRGEASEEELAAIGAEREETDRRKGPHGARQPA